MLQHGSAVTGLLQSWETLFWVSWAGEGHTDEVPASHAGEWSFREERNIILQKLEFVFFRHERN